MKNSTETQRDHFNTIAQEYSRTRESANHVLLKKLMWAAFFKRAKIKKIVFNKVLEPMCGMAEAYKMLRENFGDDFAYKGFDFSDEMVKLSKEKNKHLDIEWNDVTAFRGGEVKYDLIVILAGLHHVYSKVNSVVQTLSENQSKNGYFISFEPTHNNFIYETIRRKIYEKNEVFDSETEQGFDYQKFNKVFESNGYKKIDEVYPGLSSYILYFNPDAFPRLNVGGQWLVKMLFSLDRLFWSNWIGRKFSFATLTLWQKK